MRKNLLDYFPVTKKAVDEFKQLVKKHGGKHMKKNTTEFNKKIKKLNRLVKEIDNINKKTWPISKHSKKTNWLFVQETIICTYEEALVIAKNLQQKDKKYSYRIWDCR